MSNLTPEQRPDKNGKIVTRYVKDPSAASTGASKIPNLVPLETLRRNKIVDKLSVGVKNKEFRARVRTKLKSFSSSTMDLLEAVVVPASRRDLERLSSTVSIGDESYIRQSLYFWEVHNNRYGSSSNTGMVIKYLDAPTDEDDRFDEIHVAVAKAHAICTLADMYWLMTGNVNRVREIHEDEEFREIVELFGANPDRAVEVSDLMMRSRMRPGRMDATVVRSYFETPRALTDGVL